MKKYDDIEDTPIMASESVISCEVSHPHRVPNNRDSMQEYSMHTASPNAHTPEEMHTILTERIRKTEAGEEDIVPHQVVCDSIHNKYGF